MKQWLTKKFWNSSEGKTNLTLMIILVGFTSFMIYWFAFIVREANYLRHDAVDKAHIVCGDMKVGYINYNNHYANCVDKDGKVFPKELP